MNEKLNNLNQWVETKTREVTNRCECELSKPFGIVTMQDGRKAQVVVTLQLDEEEWY